MAEIIFTIILTCLLIFTSGMHTWYSCKILKKSGDVVPMFISVTLNLIAVWLIADVMIERFA